MGVKKGIIMQTRGSKFIKFQELKIQELVVFITHFKIMFQAEQVPIEPFLFNNKILNKINNENNQIP